MQLTKLTAVIIFGIGFAFNGFNARAASKIDWNKLEVNGSMEIKVQPAPTPVPECKTDEPCPQPEPCPAGEVCPAPTEPIVIISDPVVILKEQSWTEWTKEHRIALGAAGTIVVGGIAFFATGDTAALRDAATTAHGFVRYVQLGDANRAIVDATADALLMKQRLVASAVSLSTWLAGFAGLQAYFANNDATANPSSNVSNEKEINSSSDEKK